MYTNFGLLFKVFRSRKILEEREKNVRERERVCVWEDSAFVGGRHLRLATPFL